MVNEKQWTPVVMVDKLGDQGDVVEFKCDDGLAISAGMIMTYESERKISNAATLPFAGITAAAKAADDGHTTIPVYTYGIGDFATAGGTIHQGQYMVLSGGNLIERAQAAKLSGNLLVGQSYAEVTSGASNVIQVKFRGR